MAFILRSGRSTLEHYPKKASTVFTNGGLVYPDGSGAIQPADATSGDHIGLIQTSVAATDDDYASNTVVPVLKIYEDNICEVDVSTGTLTTAMLLGKYDLADANGIDVSAQSKLVVTIVGFISTTKALVKINAIIETANVATT